MIYLPCGWCAAHLDDEEEIFCSPQCEISWYDSLNESEYDYGD
jgi:hypothetical protein